MACDQKRLSGEGVAINTTLDLASLKNDFELPREHKSKNAYESATRSTPRAPSKQTNAACIATCGPKRLAYNEPQEWKMGVNNTRRVLSHRCSKITPIQFNAAVNANPVTALYEKKWGVKASHLNFLCGINGLKMYCNSSNLLSGHNSRIVSMISNKGCTISQSLIPIGMPFKIEDSSAFGCVISTPFYSLIVALLPRFPTSLYSIHELRLSRIIENYVFRHELSFNTCIMLELPTALKKAYRLKQWDMLVTEVKEFMLSSGAYPPMPLLCQALLGLRALMCSVLPATLGTQVKFYTNLERFLEGDAIEKHDAMLGFITFLLKTLDACVIPLRRNWVQEIRVKFEKCLEEGSCGAHRMVSGLESAVRLLSLTKIDQLNARLQDRVSSLRFTSENLEVGFIETQIRVGKFTVQDFVRWLKPQPLIKDILDENSKKELQVATVSASHKDPQCEDLLSKLVAGFLWSYLRSESRRDISVIFQSDQRRISSLQSRFDNYVLECLNRKLDILASQEAMKFAVSFGSHNIKETPVYRLIELRELATIARHLDLLIVQRLESDQQTSLAGLFNSQSVNSNSGCDLDSITAEIGILLSLHWMGARRIYKEACHLIIK